MMANLVAESGGNKGQLSNLVEAVCRDFRKHDDEELQKLVEWQRQVKTGIKGSVPIGCEHPKTGIKGSDPLIPLRQTPASHPLIPPTNLRVISE